MTLDEKKEKVKGLFATIELNSRLLAYSEKEKTEALEYGLSSRLQELSDECRGRELDLKIEYMQKLVKVLKNNTFDL